MSPRHDQVVVPVEHGDIFARLMGEYLELCRDIFLVAPVPIEVIGGYVEQQRHPGCERLHRLQLKTRYLRHDKVHGGPFLPGTGRELDKRRPDVSPHEDLFTTGFEDRAQQRGRRRLPVGPGHRDDRSIEKPEGKLDLTDDPDPLLSRLGQRLHEERHAGADHDQVGGQEGCGVMPAQVGDDPQVAQLGKLGLLSGKIGHIGQRHPRAPPGEKSRGAHPRPGAADDNDVCPGKPDAVPFCLTHHTRYIASISEIIILYRSLSSLSRHTSTR